MIPFSCFPEFCGALPRRRYNQAAALELFVSANGGVRQRKILVGAGKILTV
jgi:hypothetical protein